jgi:hypothetical protein
LIGFVCDGGVAGALPSFDFSFAGLSVHFPRHDSKYMITVIFIIITGKRTISSNSII